MQFASDNSGPVHPKILEALASANEGYAIGYGDDTITQEARERIRDLFGEPDAVVQFVTTGTAANSLILATLANPWDAIYCTEMAHIQLDECNAPEFYTGGAKLTVVHSENAKMQPGALDVVLKGAAVHDLHCAQPGPISITQTTENGSVYSLDEIRAITEIAAKYNLPCHLDGARFANAMVQLGCSAREMTKDAGIHAVSFGGTKNGLLGVEACIIFDPAVGREFELRRKRGGHLLSKHRYLAAQMLAYLTDDLWIELACAANARSAQILAGMGSMENVEIDGDPCSNLLFARFARSTHQRLKAAGAVYYSFDNIENGDPDEPVLARFVTNWATSETEVARLLDILNT